MLRLVRKDTPAKDSSLSQILKTFEAQEVLAKVGSVETTISERIISSSV